jgi:hypothetical protein
MSSTHSPRDPIPALLKHLLQKHKRCLGLQAPPVLGTPIVSSERLKQYEEEGYGTMTHDRPRNAIYLSAIRQAVAGGCHSFLEIGCGGDACLTRMVLDQPGTTVAAFEGNESAASGAYALLLNRGYCESRYSIHPVLSTAPALQEVASRVGLQAVLQEVLGYIASREGVVPVFRDLQRRVGRESWTAIPSHCATFFTPTLVQLPDVRHNLTHAVSLLGSLGGHPVRGSRSRLFSGSPGERHHERGARNLSSSSSSSSGSGSGGSRISTSTSSSSSASAGTQILSAPFLLVSRLPLREDVCPFWKSYSKALGTGMPYCGALEYLSLEEDMETQLFQMRTATFTATRRSTVNSLSCFIWVGFNPPCKDARPGGARAGAPSSSSASSSSSSSSSGGGGGGSSSSSSGSSPGSVSRSESFAASTPPTAAAASPPCPPDSTPPQRTTRSAGPMDPGPGGGTSYPYGVEGLPSLRSKTLALSTAQCDNLDLVANNWPNLVVWLPAPITLEPGQQLQVQSWADLEADPHVYSA